MSLTKKDRENIETIKKFINNVCYPPLPPMIDDCLPVQCFSCGEGAWLPEDVKHKKGCRLIAVNEAFKQLEPPKKPKKKTKRGK